MKSVFEVSRFSGFRKLGKLRKPVETLKLFLQITDVLSISKYGFLIAAAMGHRYENSARLSAETESAN